MINPEPMKLPMSPLSELYGLLLLLDHAGIKNVEIKKIITLIDILKPNEGGLAYKKQLIETLVFENEVKVNKDRAKFIG